MRVRRHIYAIILGSVLIFGLNGCNRGRNVEAAREDRQPSATPAEQEFMMKASETHIAEIETARIALRKTDNVDVREYANMIVSDHTRALEDLTDLMKDRNVSQPRTLPVDTTKDIDRMNQLTGPEFDREFINSMVADHQKAVEMFRDHSAIAQNAGVKKYADDLLPELEMHLEKAQRLQSKLFSSTGVHRQSN